MSPTEFRKNAQGVKISYGIADSPLGKVLVAMTGAGVCAVSFGDQESALERRPSFATCHRVVGSDGKLTGYRWGVERKRRLLELERAARASA